MALFLLHRQKAANAQTATVLKKTIAVAILRLDVTALLTKKGADVETVIAAMIKRTKIHHSIDVGVSHPTSH